MTFKTCCLCWKIGVLLLRKHSPCFCRSVFYSFFPSADGWCCRWTWESRAEQDSCCLASLLLRSWVFVIFTSLPFCLVWVGFFKHFVHWKNKEEGRTGHMANKAELKREKKESGNLTFNININPRGAMYVMQNLRWHFTFILLFDFWAVYLYFKHRLKPSLKQLPRTRSPQNPGNILILRWRKSTYF